MSGHRIDVPPLDGRVWEHGQLEKAQAGWVKSEGRWIIEAATHSVVSRAVHFGDSGMAAHPEIVDLEPNMDARPVAITGQL